MRIAYFSPLPPQKSGIADYSATLLPSLAEMAEIDVFVDDNLLPQLPPHPSISIHSISSFRGPLDKKQHICIYQMGADVHYHDKIFQLLRRYPGITVLHDVNMNSFFGELYLMRGQITEYTRLMAYAYSEEGLSHARSAHRGETPYDTAKYLLIEPLIERSLGVIVHSHYAESLIRARRPGVSVKRIPLVTDIAFSSASAEEAKLQLGFEQSDLIIAAFGYISPTKRLEKLLSVSSMLRNKIPHIKLAIVGEAIDGYDLYTEIAALGLADITRVTGYVKESELRTYLAATDVGFNLRYPTIGESSATLVALMASAKPTLVSNVDAFVEYPDDACIKIDIGEHEEFQIASALNKLLSDAELRRQIGHNARRYVEFTCAPALVAQQYMEFVETVLNEIAPSKMKASLSSKR